MGTHPTRLADWMQCHGLSCVAVIIVLLSLAVSIRGEAVFERDRM